MPGPEGFSVARSVCIRGRAEEVFRIVSDVQRWPELTSAFRDARVILRDGDRSLTGFVSQHDGRRYGMVSYRESFPPSRMSFEHLVHSGWFARHWGEWTFTQVGARTRVTLVHRIVPKLLPASLVGPVVDRFILGPHTAAMLGELGSRVEALLQHKEDEP